MSGTWSFAVDRGGTYSDLVARTPSGELKTAKVLSVNDKEYEDAAVHGICQFLGVSSPAEIPAGSIDTVRVGTTVATNALLERRGASTVFITTKGFRDALRIGHQARPDLFARHVQLHSMLYREDCVVEVEERMAPDGTVVTPINEKDLADKLATAFAKVSSSGSFSGSGNSSSDNNIYGVSAAIVFVHSYKNPAHEKCAAALAKQAGFAEVVASHEVSPIIRFVPRGDTTVVDAYVTPPVVAYAGRLKRLLPKGTKLQFMQSSGGLATAEQFRGKDAVLSGPAGGVVGMVETAVAAGCSKVVSFDSGGTSCDTSSFSGEYERETENTIEGIRVRAPMMSIHTIAAGGGSVLGFDGHRLLVGPHSVGAQPGPACYGRGGDLAITDANVLLGRIHPDFFPATFGADSKQKLDVGTVREKFVTLAEKVSLPAYSDPRELAAAFLKLAAQQMADAVKKISVAKGYDISGDAYVLQCFGGSGGQLACAVADNLGVKKIMMHPCASVLSAYGIGLAKPSCTKQGDLNLKLSRKLRPSDDDDDDASAGAAAIDDKKEMALIRAMCNKLEEDALVDLGVSSSASSSSASTSRPRLVRKYILHVCYDGGDVPLDVHLHKTATENNNKQQQQQQQQQEASSSSSPLLDEDSISNLSAPFIWRTFEEHYNKRYSHLMPNDIVVTVATVEVLVDESLFEGCKTTEQLALLQQQQQQRTTQQETEKTEAVPARSVECFVGGQVQPVNLFHRDRLPVDAAVDECSLVVDRLTTSFIDKGWTARLDHDAVLWIEKKEIEVKEGTGAAEAAPSKDHHHQQQQLKKEKPDPLRLELMGHLFMQIAEQMGTSLKNTAWSVNIKERLDYSCAIFTKDGLLVANAPHMPVHLGSMGMSIKRVLEVMEEIHEGVMTCEDEDQTDYFSDDIFIVNDPFAGGTHLPDITLISPVFAHNNTSSSSSSSSSSSDGKPQRGRDPDFFIASRGHHADIGGSSAGSLPPFSKHVDEEGVRLNGFRWRSNGKRRDSALKMLFTDAQPEGMAARNWPQNLGDLLAQVAANERGARELGAAVTKYGIEEINRYMGHLLDFGENSVREALGFLSGASRTGEVRLDNGARIKVKISVSENTATDEIAATIDFTGSSKMLHNNFNAPRAVTYAAVLYSVRLLVANNSLPLNEGCLRPLKIVIPPKSFLSAENPAPVVAGNVETSMCVTNAILHAFGAVADAQPTMNNFTFGMKGTGEGDCGKQYYETICGGTGAGPLKLHAPPRERGASSAAAAAAAVSSSSSSASEEEGFNGTSAVQAHMTNSRLTDTEVLETRYPVRVQSFEIARGTGGEGRFRGGDGTRRAVTFLEAAEVCVLSNGRVWPARGLDGGGEGSMGKNVVVRRHGGEAEEEEEELASLVQIDVEAGDTVIIQTPGGGGYLPAE